MPFLFKYGYDGPIYCSAPTSNLMTLLQLDYLDVAKKQGIVPMYDQKDVRKSVLHSIPLRYGVVTDGLGRTYSPAYELRIYGNGNDI